MVDLCRQFNRIEPGLRADYRRHRFFELISSSGSGEKSTHKEKADNIGVKIRGITILRQNILNSYQRQVHSYLLIVWVRSEHHLRCGNVKIKDDLSIHYSKMKLYFRQRLQIIRGY